jgi:hypothetical protein
VTNAWLRPDAPLRADTVGGGDWIRHQDAIGLFVPVRRRPGPKATNEDCELHAQIPAQVTQESIPGLIQESPLEVD